MFLLLSFRLQTVVAGSDAYAAATVSKLLSCMGIQARITTNLGWVLSYIEEKELLAKRKCNIT